MGFFKIDKIINRLNLMVDNAIEGKPIENVFDETKMSALETKLSHYLAANSATKIQLAEEKSNINRLISDISHQTKTPISNILLYAQILGERNLPDMESQYVQSLVEQAEKLNFLISSLVKVSRLETGIIEVSPKSEDISSLLDEVICQALPKAENKNIDINFIKTEAKALFDYKWTVEAIYNIVDNAIKYTSVGGNIDIRVTTYELFARIDIIDTGIGICEDEITKVFTRFYRSPSVTDEDGVGIGLYLTREIISNEGGYIKVQSEVGKGSTFSVFIPMK